MDKCTYLVLLLGDGTEGLGLEGLDEECSREGIPRGLLDAPNHLAFPVEGGRGVVHPEGDAVVLQAHLLAVEEAAGKGLSGAKVSESESGSFGGFYNVVK